MEKINGIQKLNDRELNSIKGGNPAWWMPLLVEAIGWYLASNFSIDVEASHADSTVVVAGDTIFHMNTNSYTIELHYGN